MYLHLLHLIKVFSASVWIIQLYRNSLASKRWRLGILKVQGTLCKILPSKAHILAPSPCPVEVNQNLGVVRLTSAGRDVVHTDAVSQPEKTNWHHWTVTLFDATLRRTLMVYNYTPMEGNVFFLYLWPTSWGHESFSWTDSKSRYGWVALQSWWPCGLDTEPTQSQT